MEYLAKSKPQETLAEHTQNVLNQYDLLMSLYGELFTKTEKELIQTACEIHDYGKINLAFQSKIKGDKKYSDEIPHGFLSVLFLNRKEIENSYGKDYLFALITAVYYHHVRPEKITDNHQFKETANKFLTDETIIDYFGKGMNLSFINRKKRIFDLDEGSVHQFDEKNYQRWIYYLVIKGILNKLDYAASGYYRSEQRLDQEEKAVTTCVQDSFNENPDIKGLLPAQAFMAENCNQNLIVIAPTGSGKTEGALFWLNNAKGFYTLPMKVSANAIYERIKDTYDFKKVSLLHSDGLAFFLNNRESADEDPFIRYTEVKRLSSLLTVCTIDQLFKFVFKSPGTEIFPATLRYSKLIIDELQMYSPEIIAFILYGLKIINDLGGKFLIMTATLPPFIIQLMREQSIQFKFETFTQGRFLFRHRISLREGEFDTQMILKAGVSKKVLVLCNTIKSAQKLYQELKEKASVPVKLLHSGFIKKHRSKLEEEIISFTREHQENPEPGIWISTQIVEASLDIDFDMLFTELSPIDSLFQRFGRCYRSRNYDGKDPNIFIFKNDNGRGMIYDEEIYDRTYEELKKWENCLINEEDKQKMIEAVYDEKAIMETNYYQTIKKTFNIVKQIIPNEIKSEEVNYLFRKINSVSVIPDSVYKANQDEIETLKEIICSCGGKDGYSAEEMIKKSRARDDLNQFTVNINLYHKWPKSIDKDPISPLIDIYRSASPYDFDEKKMTGGGIFINELDVNEQCL
ncbi:MAG: CRISPR-associated endonuclease/helicase Cas3 [Eubacteriaceae bacterium]|jgi:CRISPR-associated endonuclease/helicase Cas3|nr:CRISPR-associated endonuclease/helicase Cas3 [Eubacteriaceae bacterium]